MSSKRKKMFAPLRGTINRLIAETMKRKQYHKDKRYAAQSRDVRDSVTHRYGKKGIVQEGRTHQLRSGLSSLPYLRRGRGNISPYPVLILVPVSTCRPYRELPELRFSVQGYPQRRTRLSKVNLQRRLHFAMPSG